MLDGGQVHRAALAAHQAVVALHQFAQHLLDRHAARQRMGVAAIGAERQVAWLHRPGEAGGNRLLAERKVARALDQILEEEIVGPLLGLPDYELQAEEFQSKLLADVIVPGWRPPCLRPLLFPGAGPGHDCPLRSSRFCLGFDAAWRDQKNPQPPLASRVAQVK